MMKIGIGGPFMKQMKEIAIIDIGSNTVRLVVYQISPMGNFSQLQNVKLPVRLYQYLDGKQQLSTDGIKRLIEVIQLFQTILNLYKTDELIATATAVIRQAKNHVQVLTEVEKATGLSLRLLSEQEEAYYGQYAIARTTQFSEGYTIDMGGGSTEITYFKNNKIQASHSFPFGVVTLKNLFFVQKPHNDKKAIKKAQEYVYQQFKSEKWIKPRNLPIIAIGGSARNIASVHQITSDYPLSGIHEYEMHNKNLQETFQLFQDSSFEELQNLDGLSKDRVDIILPANLTFLAFCEIIEAPKFVFCNKGLREGLLLEKLNQEIPNIYDPDHVKEGVLNRLTETYGINVPLANKRRKIANQLLKLCQAENFITVNKTFHHYIYYTSILYHVGSYIEEDDSSMHSFYLIANSNLNGFSHKQRVILALLASYKNKSLTRKFLSSLNDWFTSEEMDLIRQAGCLMKFTEALLVTQVNEIISMLFEKTAKKTYRLVVEWQHDPLAEEYRATRQKKNLETVINKSITLDFKKVSY